MSRAQSRLSKLVDHLRPPSSAKEFHHRDNFHSLSPTTFLSRAASIEPDVDHAHSRLGICLPY